MDTSTEIVTINGVTYTLLDDTSWQDVPGYPDSVTGIEKGKLEITLESSTNTTTITVDGTTSFDFTASAENNGLKMQVGENSVVYSEGTATYSADEIVINGGSKINVASDTFGIAGTFDIESGNLTFKTAPVPVNELNLYSGTGLAMTFDTATSISVVTPESTTAKVNISDTTLTFTTDDKSGLNAGFVQDSVMNVVGSVKYNTADKAIRLEKGATANVQNSDTAVAITANGDSGVNFSYSNTTLTATSAKDENLGVEVDDNKFNIEGSFVLDSSSGTMTLPKDSVLNETVNRQNIVITSLNDSGSVIDFSDTALVLSSAGSDTNSVNISSNGIEAVINGSFTLNDDGTVKVDKDAEISYADSDSTFKVTDENGGILSFVSTGITFTPAGEDENLELTLAPTSDTATATSLDVKGKMTYGKDGNITISEGGVVTNTIDSDTSVVITANTADSGNFLIDPQSGLTVTPSSSDTFTIDIIPNNNVSFNVTYLNGSISYKDDILTNAGLATGIAGFLNVNGKEQSFDSYIAYGSTNLKFNLDSITYTATDDSFWDTKFMSLETDETSSIIISDGSMRKMLDGSANYITSNTNVTATSDTPFILENAGTYTLNNNTITATAANVEVTLPAEGAVEFGANAGVSVASQTFAGDATVHYSDGQASLIMSAVGNATLNGKPFELLEASSNGTTITTAENGFTVAQVITEEGVPSYGSNLVNLSFIYSENVTISGDDSYTTSLDASGIFEISGISSNTTITAISKIDDEISSESLFFIETDSAGKFSFDGNSSYEFTDSNVKVGIEFDSSGKGSILSIDDLEGTVTGKFDIAYINDTIFFIDNKDAEINIASTDDGFSISGTENAAYIEVASDKVTVSTQNEELTLNGVTYTTEGDAEGFTVSGNNEFTGLDSNAKLTISKAGTYNINNTGLKVTEKDTIIGVTEDYAYIYDESNPNFTSDTSSATALEALGIDASNTSIVGADSTDTLVALSDLGKNAAVVSKDIASDTQITMGEKGNAAIIEATNSDTAVSVIGGAGDDTIVTQGDNVTFDMRNGGADKIMATGGKVTLKNYDPSTDAGINLGVNDVQKGIKLGDDGVKLGATTDESGTTVADAEVAIGKDNFVNLYMPDGTQNKVGYATSTARNLKYYDSKDNLILMGGGEYRNIALEEEVGDSTIQGGSGNDTIYGGAGDSINAGAGNNYVQMSDKGGSTLDITEGKTTVDGFNFAGDDSIDADELQTGNDSISGVEVKDGAVILKTDNGKVQISDAENKNIRLEDDKGEYTAQFGNKALDLNDDANVYWAAGKDATVSVGEGYTNTDTELELSLKNADFTDTNVISFAGDIKNIDASGFKGQANLVGNDKNNVLTASEGGSTLDGGKGKDTLVGGDSADEFIFGEGKTTISGFTEGIGEKADILNAENFAIKGVEVSNNDVVLKTTDGNVKIQEVAGKTIQLENKYTNDDTVAVQFADKSLEVNNDANFYWAAGKNAKVSIGENYTNTDTVALFDLSNAKYNDTSQLSFYGDIKELDANGYAKKANINGNNKHNVLTASKGGSELWGGSGGNDTLIGGDGEDTFIFGAGNGNDVVTGANASDTVVLQDLKLSDLVSYGNTLFDGDDVKIKLKGGGSLLVENAMSTEVVFEIDGKSYCVDSESKKWKRLKTASSNSSVE